jgi:glycosyltransferase involved in cell wall biosynthesis
MKIGIDASRSRSGGAVAHLLGILNAADPQDFGISVVHLWSYKSLLDKLPDYSWLVKHSPKLVNRSLLQQLCWQRFKLNSCAKELGCEILLNTDAACISTFSPAVTMSRDMLSYEPGQIELYGWSLPRFRLWLLKHVQSHSLARADGAIFLTQYAARVIQQHSGKLNDIAFIPHGVGEEFRRSELSLRNCSREPDYLECVYVSNAAPYKNQLNVIKAIEKARNMGYRLHLKLVGAGSGRSAKSLALEADELDPKREFVEIQNLVPQSKLPEILSRADIFIFASSCENMPNTLVEAMAAKLPIACSDRGPMPEVLGDNGLYFDPLDTDSIAAAVIRLAEDTDLRRDLGESAGRQAEQYTWKRCAMETWSYLLKVNSKKTELRVD